MLVTEFLSLTVNKVSSAFHESSCVRELYVGIVALVMHLSVLKANPT